MTGRDFPCLPAQQAPTENSSLVTSKDKIISTTVIPHHLALSAVQGIDFLFSTRPVQAPGGSAFIGTTATENRAPKTLSRIA